MSPFPLIKRTRLRETASQFQLAVFAPQLPLHGLMAGVDNLRPDVYLSGNFTEIARGHLARLIQQHGDVELLARTPESNPFGESRYGRAHIKDDALPEAEVDYPAQFKSYVAELQSASLRQAREADDMQLDLLCRVALIKFLRAELNLQFNHVLELCRANLKKRDERRLELQQLVLRDRFLRFQVSKRQVLRRVARDVLATLDEVERETTASLRSALFGDREAASYEVLNNRLLLSDSNTDPFMRAEQYALFGGFDRDPDRFERVVAVAKGFLKKLGLARSDLEADHQLNVPGNAKMLMYSGLEDDSERGRAQRAITVDWMEMLEAESVMDYAVAAYEVVPILGDYGAVVSPQQLKCALILSEELDRVEQTLESYDRYPLDKLYAALQRVRGAGRAERMRYAARYFIDLVRMHLDVRKTEVLEHALESINVVNNERLRQLSKINGTLYEFLLPDETKPEEQRIGHHVVLKADVRDSTFLTRSLLERGLNPASYFSLNFFDPVNKLLPKYGAEKVFIEGDAVILTLQEVAGQRAFSVARTCVLAREMLKIVRAYNSASRDNGLPDLEIGIGIAYQDSAPLYLMDGAHPIMISDALNLSDRLSACNKRARRHLKEAKLPFNVLVFQSMDEHAGGAATEEPRFNYNVGGIHLPLNAFQKLQEEISLDVMETDLPMPWGSERARIFRGLVPVSAGVFRPIMVREGRVARVEARSFRFLRWSEHLYYEVCSNPELIASIERRSQSQPS